MTKKFDPAIYKRVTALVDPTERRPGPMYININDSWEVLFTGEDSSIVGRIFSLQEMTPAGLVNHILIAENPENKGSDRFRFQFGTHRLITQEIRKAAKAKEMDARIGQIMVAALEGGKPPSAGSEVTDLNSFYIYFLAFVTKPGEDPRPHLKKLGTLMICAGMLSEPEHKRFIATLDKPLRGPINKASPPAWIACGD